jgi:ankyrin repeat protein
MNRASEDLVRNAAGGQTILVRKNLKDGADPNFMNGESTALNNAVFGMYDKIVGMLLDAGADINKKDERGLTPLQLAASKGSQKIVSMLLDKGADLTANSTSSTRWWPRRSRSCRTN